MAEYVDTREIWDKAGALEGGGKDPFNDPYGPTGNCFSDNDVARMFLLGVLPSDRQHLEECAVCRQRIERNAAAMESMAPPAAPQGLRGWLRSMGGILSGPRPARLGERLQRHPGPPVGARALVFVPATLVQPDGRVPMIRIQLLAHARNVEDLRRMTLSLEGPAVSGGQARIVDEGEGVPWVEFHDVQLSRRAIRELAHHHRITEPLVIRGEDPAQPLIGTSNIELQRA